MPTGYQISSGSAKSLATRDVERYGQLLLSKGGSDIFANGEAANLRAYAEQLYAIAGRTDFVDFRIGRNMGYGSVAYGFHGKAQTLVNGPLWGTNGVAGTDGGPEYIQSGNTVTNPGDWTVIAVAEGRAVNGGGFSVYESNFFALWNRLDGIQYSYNYGYEGSVAPVASGFGMLAFRSPAAGSILPDHSYSYNGALFTNLAAAAAAAVNTNQVRWLSGYGNLSSAAPQAFGLVAQSRLTDTQIAQIYAAYKTSIGQGLELP